MNALFLGRRTYEIFADHWPTTPEEMPLDLIQQLSEALVTIRNTE